jgi:hypothetical protein
MKLLTVIEKVYQNLISVTTTPGSSQDVKTAVFLGNSGKKGT